MLLAYAHFILVLEASVYLIRVAHYCMRYVIQGRVQRTYHTTYSLQVYICCISCVPVKYLT